ncbi:ubiquitin-conjugating enzyme/RWD-like protein [Phlyctochytrium arcticum]|nr:ubiquitin-conjugating enzyme/RWD-like protein [Phlyctochytrium arcticum]
MSSATTRSAAVKRLMRELADLESDPSPEFTAGIIDDNLFDWHFTIRGPSEGGFEGGRFHGRLVFPVDYPFKPPNISFLTPNGRFEVGKKICLSITGHHPEFWRPAWGVRTALVALISFLPTRGDGAIGSLDYTEEERRQFAAKSRDWSCTSCGKKMSDVLPDEADAPRGRLLCEPDIVFSTAEPATEAVAGSSTDRSNTVQPAVPSVPSAPAPPATPAVGPSGSSSLPAVDNRNQPAPSAAQPASRNPAVNARVNTSNAGVPANAAPPQTPMDSVAHLQQRLRQIDQGLWIIIFLIAVLMIRRLTTGAEDMDKPLE